MYETCRCLKALAYYILLLLGAFFKQSRQLKYQRTFEVSGTDVHTSSARRGLHLFGIRDLAADDSGRTLVAIIVGFVAACGGAATVRTTTSIATIWPNCVRHGSGWISVTKKFAACTLPVSCNMLQCSSAMLCKSMR